MKRVRLQDAGGAEGRRPKPRRPKGEVPKGEVPKAEVPKAEASGLERCGLRARGRYPEDPGGLLAGLELRDGDQAGTRSHRGLIERCARFGEAVIRLGRRAPRTPVNAPLVTQLVAAATSVGANFCEADDSVSDKEFRQKVGYCRKESKEAMFFLRMVAAADETLAPEARALWKEARELNLIFGSIWRRMG